MSVGALFGLSVAMSFIASGIIAWLFVWPRLKVMSRDDALLPLVVPHTFRFVGLSFLVPGVVSPSVAPAFAAPAAYGDLGAAILAIAAVFSLRYRTRWVGDPARLAIQPLGHDRSAQCDLSRPDRGRHRSRLAWRGILHPDGDRTCAVDHTRADLPPPAATEGLILHPGFGTGTAGDQPVMLELPVLLN